MDTTGAGDTFTDVLAASLAHGQALLPSARRAAAASALHAAHRRAGGDASAAEIDALLGSA